MGVCTKERKGDTAEVLMATLKDVGGAGFAGSSPSLSSRKQKPPVFFCPQVAIWNCHRNALYCGYCVDSGDCNGSSGRQPADNCSAGRGVGRNSI